MRIRRNRLVRLAAALMVAASATSAAGQTSASQAAREISRHGAWTVMAPDGGGPSVCFAATPPKSSEPASADRGGAERGPAFVYVSAWPKDGVKSEVSIANGYTFQKGSVVQATIGPISFALFTAGDRAFVADATAELKFIDAMKKGSTMTVFGVPERGKPTKDTYSLSGLAQALAAITQGCG